MASLDGKEPVDASLFLEKHSFTPPKQQVTEGKCVHKIIIYHLGTTRCKVPPLGKPQGVHNSNNML